MKLFFYLLLISVSSRAEIVSLAHPEEKFDAAKTVLWTPLFQAAWDELNHQHGGKAVKTEPPNALMKKLDSFSWKASTVMPEGKWKVFGGPASPELLARANNGAVSLLGGKETFPERPLPPGTLSVYAMMARTLDFQKAFFKAEEPMLFRTRSEKTKVRFFGVRGSKSGDMGDSTRVLAWRPKDGSHALEIRTKQGDESVVLYRPPTPQDFSTACQWLREWRKTKFDSAQPGAWNDPQLHEMDRVEIPYVSLKTSEDFAPRLSSRRTFAKTSIPYQIGIAEMKTEFELHEKGARVRATVELRQDPFTSEPEPTPRAFLYDRPFFVFLWRDGAEWPYYGAWIGNAEALTIMAGL